MPSAESIRSRLLTRFPDADVAVEDLTGSGDHFKAHVICQEFRNVSRIDQHRMVYDALGEWMGGPIHALARFRTRVAGAVDDSRHGHHRDARQPCDVVEGTHRLVIVASVGNKQKGVAQSAC